LLSHTHSPPTFFLLPVHIILPRSKIARERERERERESSRGIIETK
jgi:hypothetical protein